MEPQFSYQPKPAPKLWLWIGISFVLLLSVGLSTYYIWAQYWPNNKHEQPDFAGLKKPIFYQGQILKEQALGEKEGLKLPFSVLKEWIDPTILYEEQSQSVIITTQDKVIRLKTSQLTGLINEKPFILHFAIEKNNNILYLPIEPLREFYKINLKESAETGAVILQKEGDVIQWGKVIAPPKHPDQTVALRLRPTIKASIAADLKQNDPVMIWGDDNGWYRVQLTNGFLGYVKKSEVALDHVEMIPHQVQKQVFVPWKPLGGKVNLTWQQVTTKNPDTSKIDPMPGLNVISPQWFHLVDGEGNLKNLADPTFVKWAQSNNYQLWALFSNGFDPKITSESLSTYDKRMKMTTQLLSFAQLYHLQGINIDFENVYLKDKANMVQFVREMVPFLHEQGLVVSIDVTVRDGSETYSQFMDRRAVGEIVDYMMVMTYDEYWATSPKAGSVASLPWVEKGIAQIIKEDTVPPSKIILGVPFYTRIWTEQTKDGKMTVSSKAVSMEAVQKIIKDKNLAPAYQAETGQNYVQYVEGDKTMKIWIEDNVSMKSRIELVKKLDISGVASWSRTFETANIWTLIKDTLEEKP